MAATDITEIRKVREYKITAIHEDVPKVKIYKLSPIGEQLPNFIAGQFVNLHVDKPDGTKIFRAYSVASAPSSKELELCIKILDDGRLSSLLDKKGVNDIIGISGPYGFFKYENQRDCVFIAAGTGIAPVMSMLRHIDETKVDGKFSLLYTNKFQNSVIYHDELKQMNGSSSSISVVFTLTQDVPEEWKHEKGRINKEMIAKYMHKHNANHCHFYICGPLEFIKQIKEAVISMGAKPENIKVEGWG